VRSALVPRIISFSEVRVRVPLGLVLPLVGVPVLVQQGVKFWMAPNRVTNTP